MMMMMLLLLLLLLLMLMQAIRYLLLQCDKSRCSNVG
jgi:hypothetical protein